MSKEACPVNGDDDRKLNPRQLGERMRGAEEEDVHLRHLVTCMDLCTYNVNLTAPGKISECFLLFLHLKHHKGFVVSYFPMDYSLK
jgi:hypothetical protein